MKETTFGNSAAAKTLAVMLTELNDPKVSKSVSRFLLTQSEVASSLNILHDSKLTELFRMLYLGHIRTVKLVGVTGKIESFMKNVAVAKFRQKS